MAAPVKVPQPDFAEEIIHVSPVSESHSEDNSAPSESNANWIKNSMTIVKFTFTVIENITSEIKVNFDTLQKNMDLFLIRDSLKSITI